MKITWQQIIAEQPYLKILEENCKSLNGAEPDWCANKFWYGEIKPQLVELVGRYSKIEALRNSDAYYVAYRHLYDPLPPCHEGCNCI